jgi:hypothetical protein
VISNRFSCYIAAGSKRMSLQKIHSVFSGLHIRTVLTSLCPNVNDGVAMSSDMCNQTKVEVVIHISSKEASSRVETNPGDR